MYSGEGEEVKLFSAISPTENVENWLLEVEKCMKASVRDNIEKSIVVYPEVRILSQTGRSLMCWFLACHGGHQRWGLMNLGCILREYSILFHLQSTVFDTGVCL